MVSNRLTGRSQSRRSVGETMIGRIAVVLGLLFGAMPAQAGDMRADEARRFVAGKLFAYSCFEGTRGAGRIFNDGSSQ